MVSTVTSTMDLVAGVSEVNKSQTKTTPNDSFDQILNQQTNHQAKVEDVKKPVNEMKKSNVGHVRKTDENQVKEKIVSTVDLDKLQEDTVNKITEILGITEEELNQILAELNMTAFDLLIPDKLNSFLTTLFNVDDSFQLLSIPNVIGNIKELKMELSQLTQALDLSEDDIKDIIDKAKGNQTPSQSIETENATTITDPQVASTEEEDTNKESQSQIPQVNITDERTEKDMTTSEEPKVDMNKGQDNVTNISVNQYVQKVEVVGDNGIKEVITYNMNTEEVIDQIVSSVKINLTDDNNTMFIQLRPEHLGKLSFSLTSEQGVMTANFMAENPAIKELIESNLAQLRVSLQQQGITVDKLEVVVGDNNMFNKENDTNQFNSNSNNKRRRAAKMMNINGIHSDEEISEAPQSSESISAQIEGTSSVDYSA